MWETLVQLISIGLSKFLGLDGTTTPLDDQWLFTRVLANHKTEFMVKEVLDSENKDVLFSMGDDKAPDPDGFTAAFFKNMIITNRIKEGLGDLVSINQSAFVLGRRISDNILLTSILVETCMADLMRRVQNAEDFQYHHLCEQQHIVNLCFADDLFFFARDHPNYVRVIIDALEEFKSVLGLVPSIPKSTAFFCNVLNALKASILGFMRFAEGTLPVKHLGVPLISSRLLYHDCKVLVEKLESRLMRGFLWCQGEMKKGKAKVAWEAVCLPHHEGGLGIRRLDDFNVALMATHVWCILINKQSLWVQWIHSFKLKGRSFWDVPCLGDVSWGWQKFLQIRTRMRPFIWHKINNGRSTSMWFDRWAYSCPLRDMLTVRNILRSGFSLSDTVSDLISNGSWRWPHDWPSRFPNVVNITILDINNDLDDVIVWRDDQGVRAFTGMSFVPPRLVDVLAFLIPSKGSLVSNVISQIVLAAMTYCLWNEWNSRLFKKKKSNADQIAQLITSLVRMKLVTFKFKKMATGSRLLLNQWKIPSSCFDHDGSSR
ncbi:hypothetical protein Tco_0099427 [Tanacetum coccineum]